MSSSMDQQNLQEFIARTDASSQSGNIELSHGDFAMYAPMVNPDIIVPSARRFPNDHQSKKALYDSVNWPRQNTQPTPRPPQSVASILPELDGPVSYASGITYAMGGLSADTEIFRFMEYMSQKYADYTVAQMRELMGNFIKKTATLDGTFKLGKPRVITAAQHEAWVAGQKGTALICGAFRLWDVLKAAGLPCESKVTKTNRREILVYSKNGKTIQLFDRHLVYSSYADEVPATADEIAVFLGGMRHGGKEVVYSHVSPEAYLCAHAFLTKYSIQLQATVVKAQLIPIPKDENNPYRRGARLPASVLAMCDKILAHMGKAGIRASSDIEAVEEIARFIDACAVDDKEEWVADLDSSSEALINRAKQWTTKFTTLGGLPPAQRDAMLKKDLGTGDVDKACRLLKHARDLRNKTDANTIVNHGVGSVTGYALPEWFDTHRKAQNIMCCLEDFDIKVKPDQLVCVYGVAYGHMTPVFNQLREKGANVVYIDNTKSKNSREVYEIGDVFGHQKVGAWILDDSNSHVAKDKKKIKDSLNWTGDHQKLSNFVKYDSPVIVSKVTMKSFRTQLGRAALWDIFANKGYEVHVYKFGRLHNNEAYVVAIQNNNEYESSSFTVNAELNTIALAMEVSNTVIMWYQMAGLRAGFDCTDAGFNLGQLWMALVKALPTYWWWYAKTPDVSIKTILGDNEDAPESLKFGEDHDRVDDWVPSIQVKCKEEPRLLKDRMEGFSYEIPFELNVNPTIRLGYGAEDALETQVLEGKVKCVVWDPITAKFSPKDVPSVVQKRGRFRGK